VPCAPLSMLGGPGGAAMCSLKSTHSTTSKIKLCRTLITTEENNKNRIKANKSESPAGSNLLMRRRRDGANM
jgi:hypothetical protein